MSAGAPLSCLQPWSRTARLVAPLLLWRPVDDQLDELHADRLRQLEHADDRKGASAAPQGRQVALREARPRSDPLLPQAVRGCAWPGVGVPISEAVSVPAIAPSAAQGGVRPDDVGAGPTTYLAH
jgi:hypothetical protein